MSENNVLLDFISLVALLSVIDRIIYYYYDYRHINITQDLTSKITKTKNERGT